MTAEGEELVEYDDANMNPEEAKKPLPTQVAQVKQ